MAQAGTAAVLGITSFAGVDVDGTAIVARYTRIGDANLSGSTEIGDFGLLASNFNRPGSWSSGDFNYDDVTDIGDFALLAAHFNQVAPAARATVPEPSGLLVVCGVALSTLRRRRG